MSEEIPTVEDFKTAVGGSGSVEIASTNYEGLYWLDLAEVQHRILVDIVDVREMGMRQSTGMMSGSAGSRRGIDGGDDS